MTTFTRTRGDDYPIIATIKVDGNPIDLTGSILTFSYKNDDNEVRSISGNITDTLGIVEFIPESGVDFQNEGVYSFDIQRVAGGYTYTHLKGTLIVDGDVTA